MQEEKPFCRLGCLDARRQLRLTMTGDRSAAKVEHNKYLIACQPVLTVQLPVTCNKRILAFAMPR